jgi:hypothetical protein
MGKKDKDHRRKVALRNIMLGNPITRKAVALVSHKAVVTELSKGSLADQSYGLIDMLNSGALKSSKLADSLKSKAVKEMDKGIRDFQKRHKEISVETLTAEVRTETAFLEMCNHVGITVEWFEGLARERIKRLVGGL